MVLFLKRSFHQLASWFLEVKVKIPHRPGSHPLSLGHPTFSFLVNLIILDLAISKVWDCFLKGLSTSQLLDFSMANKKSNTTHLTSRMHRSTSSCARGGLNRVLTLTKTDCFPVLGNSTIQYNLLGKRLIFVLNTIEYFFRHYQ